MSYADNRAARAYDDRAPRAYTVSGRTDNARVFRAAMRHSRMVRLLRVLIPLAVVVSVGATVLAATVLDPLRALAKLPVDIGALVVSGTKITTQGPRYAGYTQDKRPYVVTARTASQDVTKPGIIELADLHATLTMKGAGQVEMTARTGLFESKADLLHLHDDILITSSSYQARLTEAVINVRTNHVVSEQPVEVTMRQGTINANRLEVTDSGEVVRFERDVVMVLTLQDADGKAGGK
jgi:lipopolysaccharide export system protein LptC